MPTGSSPLARGLLNPKEVSGPSSRIIPARAGFTPAPPSQHSRRSDHPRSRGVYASTRLPLLSGSGSSPLARGLLERGVASRMRSRIIPARAGFTEESSCAAL